MFESLGKDFKITTKNTLHETVANMDGSRWGIPVEEWKLCFKLYKKLFVNHRNDHARGARFQPPGTSGLPRLPLPFTSVPSLRLSHILFCSPAKI